MKGTDLLTALNALQCKEYLPATLTSRFKSPKLTMTGFGCNLWSKNSSVIVLILCCESESIALAKTMSLIFFPHHLFHHITNFRTMLYVTVSNLPGWLCIQYCYKLHLSHDMSKPTKWVRPAKTDQPGHPPNLIRVFAGRSIADAQADLSLRRAHTHLVGFVMSWLSLRFFPPSLLTLFRLYFSVIIKI